MIPQQVDAKVATQEEALPWIRPIADDVTEANKLLHTQGFTILEDRLESRKVGMDVADDCSLQLRPPGPIESAARFNGEIPLSELLRTSLPDVAPLFPHPTFQFTSDRRIRVPDHTATVRQQQGW